jgi:hypothetical protein
MDIMRESHDYCETIQNQYYIVSVDHYGRLVHLERKDSGYGNIVSKTPAELFRAVLKRGENWEQAVKAKEQLYEITKDDSCLQLRTQSLQADEYLADIEIVLSVRLDGRLLKFEAEIINSDDCMVTDVYYPCIGSIKSLKGGKPGLLWPDCTGQWIPDIANHLGGQAEWGGAQTLSATYPGPLSMQWMSLVDGDEVLYYAGHDAVFHTSSLRVSSVEDMDSRAVVLEIDKMAFVRPGEHWHYPECVVSLYQGSWRQGADEYASWCESWRKPVSKTRWIQDMNGYFLVIGKQQYGDEMWPYETIPSLYSYAQAFGCDTVGLFGWYDSGHDNQYPDLSVSSGLGGEQALKKGIKQVQQAGGHVTLYYQGHLIDVNSPFYKEQGKELEGRNIWNNPYYEDYSKSHSSDFLKFFSKKKFATVCPSCIQWHDLMTEKAKWVASFGPDGILYDQIGGMPAYPCFNDHHQHKYNRPSLSYTQGRLSLLKKIHEQVRALGDEYGFMTEHETDVYSQFPDALHGIGVCPAPKSGKKAGDAWTSLCSTAPQMFRYCFPETILTLRNPNPFLDPRYVNYALLYGFRFEMEIRYQGDILELQSNARDSWRYYARQVADLRMKYADVLLKGTYREQAGLSNINSSLACSLFEGQDRSCIVLWNDTDRFQKIDISAEGRTIISWESLTGQGDGIPYEMEPDSVLLLFLKHTEEIPIT